MTLKEKFQEEPVVIYQEDSKLTNQSAEKCEQIADDFAIGFADWRNSLYVATDYKNLSTKELLEIYKLSTGL